MLRLIEQVCNRTDANPAYLSYLRPGASRQEASESVIIPNTTMEGAT
jgi:hypothetical protein